MPPEQIRLLVLRIQHFDVAMPVLAYYGNGSECERHWYALGSSASEQVLPVDASPGFHHLFGICVALRLRL